MATQTERRQWRESVERALQESNAAKHYELRQRDIRRGDGGAARDRPGPLEFDALGFPIPQPVPRFMQRLGRLIYGG